MANKSNFLHFKSVGKSNTRHTLYYLIGLDVPFSPGTGKITFQNPVQMLPLKNIQNSHIALTVGVPAKSFGLFHEALWGIASWDRV